MIILDPALSLRFQLLAFLHDPLLTLNDLQNPFLHLSDLDLFPSLDHLEPLLECLHLPLEPPRPPLMLADDGRVRLEHLPHLRVVLRLDHPDQRLLRRLLLVLVQTTPLLQLLQGYLKFPLRFYQVLLVCLFLLLQELTFAFPEGFVTIVTTLDIEKLSLEFANLPSKFKDVLCMSCVTIIEGCSGTITHVSYLFL